MCCPFYNEHLVARINIEEASKWVDEIHITEFDKSFKYTEHPYEFDVDGDKVHYHPMTGLFLKPRKYIPHITLKPISRWMKKYVRDTAWYNDGISRNFEFDTLITGTSMAQNFKTSEAEALFGGKAVKETFSGLELYSSKNHIISVVSPVYD